MEQWPGDWGGLDHVLHKLGYCRHKMEDFYDVVFVRCMCVCMFILLDNFITCAVEQKRTAIWSFWSGEEDV